MCIKCEPRYITICDKCGEEHAVYRCLGCAAEHCYWCAGKGTVSGANGNSLYLCKKCWKNPSIPTKAIHEVMRKLVAFDEVTLESNRTRARERMSLIQKIENLENINCYVVCKASEE